MTGIGAILAGDSAVAGSPPPPPLSVGISLNGGEGPYYVAGASSDLGTSSSSVFVPTTTGGTPPYVDTLTLSGDPSGKLSIVLASDMIHNTIGWSGFILNELETCYVTYSVTDSLGATASVRYPASLYIAIKRTS